ncbi:MAG: hypothetical protein WCJ21_09135 [Planctomycetota bacterium]
MGTCLRPLGGEAGDFGETEQSAASPLSTATKDRFRGFFQCMRNRTAAKLVRNPGINFVQDGKILTSNGPCSGLATSLRLVEDHVGTRKKDKLRQVLSFVYPPAKGLILENGSLIDHAV